ncbi:diguanylate cyclase [Marinosulfonomonas sp. PRT-SC04]|nr:diguanylate cyclase [Marinosulfonomonas sp. PRT-SC04]
MAGLPTALFRQNLRAMFNGQQALAFIPALTLGGYWLGGEGTLLILALLLPVCLALLGTNVPKQADTNLGLAGLGQREIIENALGQFAMSGSRTARNTAALVLELDDYNSLTARLGHKACNDILHNTANKVRGVLRDLDVVCRIDGATFAIAMGPAKRADLESLIQIAARLQSAVAEPISLDATTVYVSCSIGFCLGTRAPSQTGEALLEAAELALMDARQNGPNAIRSYSSEMQQRAKVHHDLIEDVSLALENGQIRPWFQPQVSTDTGEVTGFEALARWEHPERGMIPPSDFLPAIEEAGLFERLGEVMLYHSLTSLVKWENGGITVPKVGVNFSGAELRNPKLVDKIRWELDRFDLSPDRLTIEVLETVVAGAGDDIITRNIAGLAALGCAIDLDDFGTGHASIANIRRFSVGRIKIDRSFIMKVDTDPDQQHMVAAILTMAEQLNLETLGEGVETVGEHAMLAQLGCGHIQGFGLARPMPFSKTMDWMQKHHAKLAKTPKIGRITG